MSVYMFVLQLKAPKTSDVDPEIKPRPSFLWSTVTENMTSMKLVIPIPSLYWSIHTEDESKRGTAFAFIFGVN